MSPYAIFFILFTTVCSFSGLSAYTTRYTRPCCKYPRNDTFHVKSVYNPDSEAVNYNKMRVDPRHDSLYGRKQDGKQMNMYTQRMYRSYGRGKAEIPYMGATVSVFNAVPYAKVEKGRIAGKEESAKLVSREKRKCLSCPQNRKVVASKGNVHVLLPEPCPYLKWFPLSGPRPGTLLREGSYSLLGRLGSRGKLCQYKYEVLIRRCGPIKVDSGRVNCTAEDVWGSKCSVTCDPDHELEGSDSLYCDEGLKWSSQPPVCKRKIGCSFPQTPDDRKIWCQVSKENELDGDILPQGTSCHFTVNTKKRTIICRDGYWVRKRIMARRNKMGKHGKYAKLKRAKYSQ